MYWIQFWVPSSDGFSRREALGDRSVVIVDGRESRDTHYRIGHMEGRRRGYDAFQLHRGEAFTRSTPISPVVEVEQ